ncbi:MAG: site-specific DNA-methyltransferase [Janthinobacterium lividum]
MSTLPPQKPVTRRRAVKAAPAVEVDQIYLGDCVEIMNSLPPKSVDLVFADPPYNMQLGGDLWRPNMTKVDAVTDPWDKFKSFAEYDAFTRAWLTAAQRVLKDTGTLWVIGSYHNIYRVGSVMMDVGYWVLNDICWVKANPLPQLKGTRFCNAHETLLWAKKSADQKKYTFHYHEMKAGNDDKQMRSDWYIPICSGGERETREGKKAHTTQKPEALMHRVIAATTNPGDIVLDPFCGTGTTAAVAKRLGRRYITIDREAVYVEVAEKRLANISTALLTSSDESGVLLGGPKPRIPFMSFIESERLAVGSTLRLKSSQTTAVIHADGTISAGGHRGSIHKVAAACLGLPSANGWTSWFFHDTLTQQEQLLDTLRPGA